MSKQDTAKSYDSSVFGHEMPVYPHADPDQFIVISDFDQFEAMLWHYNVADHPNHHNHQVRELRKAGTLTLKGTHLTDGALQLRLLMENLQLAYQAAQRLLGEAAAAKAELGKAKTKLMPKWQQTLGWKNGSQFDFPQLGPLDKLPREKLEAIQRALSRLDGYRAVLTKLEMLHCMRAPVCNKLGFAADELEARAGSIHSSNVQAIVHHNLMCAEHLGQRIYGNNGEEETREEALENNEANLASAFLIENQWRQYKGAQTRKIESKGWFDK